MTKYDFLIVLIPCDAHTPGIDRMRQPLADGCQQHGRNWPFGRQGDVRWPAGKFHTTVEPQSRLSAEFLGKVRVVRVFDAPESQALFLLLEELQRLLQLAHSPVKSGRQEINGQHPCL